MKTKTKRVGSPGPNRTNRRTTLSLAFTHWDQLQRIERETGARPSVVVRRILDRHLSDATGTAAWTSPQTGPTNSHDIANRE